MVEDAYAALPFNLVARESEVHLLDAIPLGTGAKSGFSARRAATEQDAVRCIHRSDDSAMSGRDAANS